jgi:hypothetical protein
MKVDKKKRNKRICIAVIVILVCLACSFIPYGEPSKSLAERVGDGFSTMFKEIGRSMDRTFN